MTVEDELTDALEDAYQRSGKEVGYWARRFIQALHRNGGRATAKRMLTPRTSGQRKGLDTLLEAGRPDLTLEAVVLQPKFKRLFTKKELAVAAERLGEYGETIKRLQKSRERLYPDELEPGHKYTEGARKIVRVNAYERDRKARKACIKHHGWKCVVCGIDFAKKYGAIGEEFIHVHHLNPLCLTDGQYELDPIQDLRPVCPNCHAMLHRPEELLSIKELKAMIKQAKRRTNR